MTSFNRSDDLQGAEFADTNLQGARFIGADLSGVVIRGCELRGAEVDSPWLFDGENSLLVNGIDVLPYVDAELNRRFPGRRERRAGDPYGLREAWALVEHAWAETLARVAAMPEGTVDISIAGEWSFAQTLRHLILATGMWLSKPILAIEQPFHPIGLLYGGAEADGHDMSVFVVEAPSFAEVLEVRANHVAMVRNYLSSVTAAELAEPRNNPHNPDYQETVLSCLHTILDEEWEHLRFAVRDLDAIEVTR